MFAPFTVTLAPTSVVPPAVVAQPTSASLEASSSAVTLPVETRLDASGVRVSMIEPY